MEQYKEYKAEQFKDVVFFIDRGKLYWRRLRDDCIGESLFTIEEYTIDKDER